MSLPNGKTIQEQAFEKACNDFEKEFVALQEKYGLVLIPKLNMSPSGIFASNMYMDRKTYDEQMARIREALPSSK